MPKWNPKKVVLKHANKYDKQKIVSDLAKIIYALALANEKSNSAKKSSKVSTKEGAA